MENLIAPSGLKLGIFRCLKAGTNVRFPEQGTPQGGVVSPLLANIALNRIEKIGEYKSSRRLITSKCIRYADDMIYVLKPQDDAKKILDEVKEFLAKRGMEISETKTKLTATTDGFNFLGWNFRVQKNGKFRSRPSVENFKAFYKKAKSIINNSNYGATVKASKLAPVVRGWRNYHRYCKMDGARNSLYFMMKRAFKVFNRETKQDRYSSKKLLDTLDTAFPKVPYSENKFVREQYAVNGVLQALTVGQR
jgi:retron-type reverse transcriptase